jgi:RHS repeat-associated protein
LSNGTYTATFSYGPSRARYKQVATYSGRTETTVYVGSLYEKFTKTGSTNTEHRYLVTAGGLPVAKVTDVQLASGAVNRTTTYLHRDHLGSVDTVTSEAGTVLVRMSFDAHGNRRAAMTSQGSAWSARLTYAGNTATVEGLRAQHNRGFTDHEMLDNVGLIHMNGRVYDPAIGRFLSVDPVFQFPENTQSLNSYTYVLNSPLSHTDPTGYTTKKDIAEKDSSSGKGKQEETAADKNSRERRFRGSQKNLERGGRNTYVDTELKQGMSGGAGADPVDEGAPGSRASPIETHESGSGPTSPDGDSSDFAAAVPIPNPGVLPPVAIGGTPPSNQQEVDGSTPPSLEQKVARLLTESAKDARDVGLGVIVLTLAGSPLINAVLSENSNEGAREPSDKPTTIAVDSKGNAIPLKDGEYVDGSPDSEYLQVKDRNGRPTGTRIDGGHGRTHDDPRSKERHAHVPGHTNEDGTEWLPVKR